jgi:hypothetical protein
MDDKFRKILERALHPSTMEGEWDSAFRAARRMVGTSSLDKLLGSPASPQVREVVRERVVYRDANYTHHLTVTFKISNTWQHTFMEIIWKDAQRMGLKIEVLHLRCQNKTVSSGLDLRLRVYGSGTNSLKWWNSQVDKYLKEINSKNKNNTRPTGPDVAGETIPKKPGFWSKLKGLFTKE